MTVAERAREVGLLRAAGATRRQVNGLVPRPGADHRDRRRDPRDRARGRRLPSSSPPYARGDRGRPDRRPVSMPSGGGGRRRRSSGRSSRWPLPSSRPIGPGASRPSRRFGRPAPVGRSGRVCAGSSSSSSSSPSPASSCGRARPGRPGRPLARRLRTPARRHPAHAVPARPLGPARRAAVPARRAGRRPG